MFGFDGSCKHHHHQGLTTDVDFQSIQSGQQSQIDITTIIGTIPSRNHWSNTINTQDIQSALIPLCMKTAWKPIHQVIGPTRLTGNFEKTLQMGCEKLEFAYLIRVWNENSFERLVSSPFNKFRSSTNEAVRSSAFIWVCDSW
jgi:hypothetical protein